MSRLRQLGKDSIIYGIGGVAAKSISFFLLPIYTRIFTPADFGTIEMLTVLSSFLGAMMMMGMDSAQSMYFFKVKEEGQQEQASVISAILQWKLVWGGGIVILATLLAPILNASFFDGRLGWEYFAVAFTGTLLSQIMSQSAEVFRLLYRPWIYIGITLSQSVIGAVSVLLLVLVFDQGIFGFFLGAAVASLLTGFIGWYMIRGYLNFKQWHKEWWPTILRFGAPLVPAGLGMYIMNTGDRWFIQHYHGASELGLYAIAAKFAILLTLVIETFRKAWWPIAMDAMHSEDGPETFRLIARLYMGVGIAGVVTLGYISPWLLNWFTTPDYYAAWPLVGILAWQPLLYGFYLIAAAGIWKAEKTHLAIYLSGGAALLNIVLNYILVPLWGSIGAALATVTTYFFWIVAALAISERLWQIRFQYPAIIMQLLVGGGATVLFVARDEENLSDRLLFSGIWLVVVSVLVLLSLGCLTKFTRKHFLHCFRGSSL